MSSSNVNNILTQRGRSLCFFWATLSSPATHKTQSWAVSPSRLVMNKASVSIDFIRGCTYNDNGGSQKVSVSDASLGAAQSSYQDFALKWQPLNESWRFSFCQKFQVTSICWLCLTKDASWTGMNAVGEINLNICRWVSFTPHLSFHVSICVHPCSTLQVWIVRYSRVCEWVDMDG